MRYLRTIFSCPFKTSFADWLEREHYPFAIDKSNDKLLTFNLSWEMMKNMIVESDIQDFAIFLHPRQFEHQAELRNYIDKAIGDSAWMIVNAIKGNGMSSSIPTKYDILLKAFNNYDNSSITKHLDSTELRAHICDGLYGIDIYDFSCRLDYEHIQEPVLYPNSGVIKNFLILAFRKLPKLQVGKSCLGSEVWCYGGDNIIAFNLPILSLDLISTYCKPEAIRYSEADFHELDTALFRYVKSEMEAIRETHHISIHQRLPFTPQLQGIDISRLNK